MPIASYKRPLLGGVVAACALGLVLVIRSWQTASTTSAPDAPPSARNRAVEGPAKDESEPIPPPSPADGSGETTDDAHGAPDPVAEADAGATRNGPPGADPGRALREELEQYAFLRNYGDSGAEAYSRSNVVDRIAKMGTREAFLALQEIWRTDPLPPVRSHALHGMVFWLDTERDVLIESLLEALLHDDSARVQATAAANIGSITPRFHRLYPDVVEALLAATRKPDPHLSIFALLELRSCLEPVEYRQLVSSRLEVEERPDVREALQEIELKLDEKEKR